MDIFIIILCVITLILFIGWLNFEETGLDILIHVGIIMILLGVIGVQPYSRFMVESKIVADHYGDTYLDHSVAIFKVTAYKKGCYLVSDFKTVIFEDPNSNPSIDDIINKITGSKKT